MSRRELRQGTDSHVGCIPQGSERRPVSIEIRYSWQEEVDRAGSDGPTMKWVGGGKYRLRFLGSGAPTAPQCTCPTPACSPRGWDGLRASGLPWISATTSWSPKSLRTLEENAYVVAPGLRPLWVQKPQNELNEESENPRPLLPPAGLPGPRPGEGKAPESRAFPLRGGSRAWLFKTVECFKGAVGREGLRSSPSRPHPIQRQPLHSGGSQRMRTRLCCSSGLFPLDVFPVNQNCRVLSAPGARDSVSPPLLEVWRSSGKASKPFFFSCFLFSAPLLAPHAKSWLWKYTTIKCWLPAGLRRTALAIGIFL